jgi:hypothetical protein
VSISKKHPEIPLFPSRDWASAYTQAPPSQSASGSSTPVTQQASPSKAKQKGKQTMAKKVRISSTHIIEAVVVEEQNTDAMPSNWPRAGQGLYAKLPPEREDVDMLVEENDEAFSHFVVSRDGGLVSV